MVDLMPLIVDEQHRAGPQKEANEVREDEVIEVMVYSKLNQAGADDPMRSGKDLDNAHQTYLQFFREWIHFHSNFERKDAGSNSKSLTYKKLDWEDNDREDNFGVLNEGEEEQQSQKKTDCWSHDKASFPVFFNRQNFDYLSNDILMAKEPKI